MRKESQSQFNSDKASVKQFITCQWFENELKFDSKMPSIFLGVFQMNGGHWMFCSSIWTLVLLLEDGQGHVERCQEQIYEPFRIGNMHDRRIANTATVTTAANDDSGIVLIEECSFVRSLNQSKGATCKTKKAATVSDERP